MDGRCRPARSRCRPGARSSPVVAQSSPVVAQSLPADGRALRADRRALPAGAQSLPADAQSLPAAGSLRLARTAGELPGGRLERGVLGDQEAQATYFERGGLHLALGLASFWQRPTAQPEGGTLLSAGLHLTRSLTVVGEMGRGWWASGRLETPGGAGPAAGCPDIRAGFHTFMGGVQYRLSRARRSTRFVQVLAGRASFAGTAGALENGGSYASCFDVFSSGLALAAGGGVDFHLTDRLALRVAAAYRRVAVPSLDGAERVFMRDDADRHLGMMRIVMGLVLGI